LKKTISFFLKVKERTHKKLIQYFLIEIRFFLIEKISIKKY